MIRRAATIAALATVLSVLSLPRVAQAATAWVDSKPGPPGDPALVYLHYAADPGEANSPHFEFKPGDQSRNSDPASTANADVAIINDPGARMIQTGFGCVPLGTTSVLCDATTSTDPTSASWTPTQGFEIAYINLGDGNDSMNQDGISGPWLVIDAGPGNDVIKTDSGGELLGGPGDDHLEAGGGGVVAGGPGADDLSGGPGAAIDSAVYGPAVGDADIPRSISLDDVANDGASGEGDNVHSNIEVVSVDTSSPNLFVGNNAPNVFVGGSGADVMYGLGGDDQLQGEAGNDYLDGGAGADTFEGGAGDDTLSARDGERDAYLFCDAGTDQLTADLIDPVSFGCEQDNRG